LRHRSSAAALAALALCLVLQQTAPESLLSPLRLALFDAYASQWPRARSADPVVIVAVDDASLREIGQWPWPRQLLAQLIDAILRGHPSAVGIDILWPEPDRLTPQRWMQQEGGLPPVLSQQLLALPDHDEVLAEALGSGPVAIGVAGLRDGTPNQTGPMAPLRVIGGEGGPDLSRQLPSFDAMLRSLRKLDRQRPDGLITVDRDADGVIRRMPLVSSVAGTLTPALGLEMLRLASRPPEIELRVAPGRVRGVVVGSLAIPTQADGTVWVHFSPHDPERFVSAADALADRMPAGVFDQKLVLLGVTGLGLVDERITPLGHMPGSEIQAQLIENLHADDLAVRPDRAAWVEPALLAGFALLLILWLPGLRLRWYFPIAGLVLAALAALGCTAWIRERWLIDVATPAVGNAAVFVSLLGGALAEANAHRRRLQRARSPAPRSGQLEGEPSAAAASAGQLPIPRACRPTCARSARVAHPARQVGGDLTTSFRSIPTTFLAIGDVSGKGRRPACSWPRQAPASGAARRRRNR
jgi:CHASE2 domain-containing sensor protein